MKIFDRFITRVISTREDRVVFRRWRLIKTPWFQLFVHAIYDHDHDHHCHDHPWDFASLVIKGGYEEMVETPRFFDVNTNRYAVDTKIRVRKLGSVAKLPAEGMFHRITRLLDGTCYTLVLASGRKRNWGFFHHVKGWVDNDTYRFLKRKGWLDMLEVGLQ